MSDLFWLSQDQMAKIEPYFPLAHGVPRVDDRRVVSGIIFVIKNGLRWRGAPSDYEPHMTLYNRFIRWSEMCVIGRIFVELAKEITVAPYRIPFCACNNMRLVFPSR
mgnify:CR=1 FL=1|tara:strand:+ start:6955 stop:7275 length:321 start_codon:yes stop_codon:yes gene_type:complete